MTKLPPLTLDIVAYSFDAFVVQLAEAIKDGWSIDTETVDNYPKQIGFCFMITLVKPRQSESLYVGTIQEETAKRGRKPKVAE